MEKVVKQVRFASPQRLRRKRVAAYARVSSGKDAMLHSLSAQISYYSDLIQSHPEWEYCGVYADEALTGTKDSRENFQRLLGDCRAGKIDIVITKSISRFARNTVTLLEAIRELKGLGIAVIFEEQRIDTLTAEGELLITLLASFAQAESLSASENMKWRYKEGFENGELLSLRHLFGYDINKDSVEINEEEADIVREIFRRFVAGESMTSIAKDLEKRNVTGLLGGRLTHCRIREFLTQEKYIGDAMMQKSYNNNHLEKKRIRNKGEKTMYYAEGTHEAIVEKDLFEQAQERIREIEDQTKGRRPVQHSIFTGRIRCAKCGKNFNQVQNRKPVWQCLTYKRFGPKGCPSKQIPDNILRRICCEVLSLNEFDEDVFNARISDLTADTDEKGNFLTFRLSDGEVIVKRWGNPSRSMSWTPEMREKARRAAMKGGRSDGSK